MRTVRKPLIESLRAIDIGMDEGVLLTETRTKCACWREPVETGNRILEQINKWDCDNVAAEGRIAVITPRGKLLFYSNRDMFTLYGVVIYVPPSEVKIK